MLHDEARGILVDAHEGGGSSAELAGVFGVSDRTVRRLAQRRRETGSVALRTHERGRKPALSADDPAAVDAYVESHPDSTIDGVVAGCGPRVPDETCGWAGRSPGTAGPAVPPRRGSSAASATCWRRRCGPGTWWCRAACRPAARQGWPRRRARGATVLHLPPYSPDLNPTEKTWSKVKTLVRGQKAREVGLLAQAVAQAISKVTPSDCVGWFRSCGYGQ